MRTEAAIKWEFKFEEIRSLDTILWRFAPEEINYEGSNQQRTSFVPFNLDELSNYFPLSLNKMLDYVFKFD